MRMETAGLVVVSLLIVSASAQQAVVQPDTGKKQKPAAIMQTDSARHQQSPTTGTTGKQSTVSGTVVGIDTTANALTVKDAKGNARTFTVSPNTKITKGGKDTAMALRKIGHGDSVTVAHSGDAAASVHVNIPKTSAPATPAETAKILMRGDTTRTDNAAVKPSATK